ncbi:hypothetical protein [Staphylococcus coagulans]|uniref:hypothetical protein n=1 Tax=Staphylococcus coagulans TaxID=74706 RepID=UPI001BE5AE3B|nr:hypothetical protein [Staphylococcus coagulans]MBT2814263.1 hypothetical protein [Staphylococcus coagulans]MBT2816583.1 hypothetical protein [Staphylococcus coagulans]MBT2836085.1 hypothetical protein [Staphylococcus coagulans]MBT2840613.1 hypothetical protein [Staphylococcus coagulans]MBT2848489.1 hypothetical protein [Staphylococcus coagulans]
MNIIVLAGGLSDERDVSLSSGAQIANALIKNGHKVLMLDLYLGLKELKKHIINMGNLFMIMRCLKLLQI